MQPKKGKSREPVPSTVNVTPNIRLLIPQVKPARMSLRSKIDNQSDNEAYSSDILQRPQEKPVRMSGISGFVNHSDNESSSSESDEEGSTVDIVEEQVSNNELARLLRSNFVELKGDIKTTNEKLANSDGKIDKLNEAMSNVSHKVETVSEETRSISVSVEKNKEDIDDIIRQQNEFNAQYEHMITLANSLQERDDMIKEMQVRIEALEAENRLSKDREEQLEQHGRKMNLWTYGLDEGENENTKQTERNFCVNILKFKGSVVDGWLIKKTHRVGEYKKPKRPVIVAFVLWEDRQTLLRAGKVLFDYNKTNDTTYAIKTDLAPRARQLRKDLHVVSNNMKKAEGCLSKVRDNPKGKVWLVRKQKIEDKKWETVTHIKPAYLPKGKLSLEWYNPPK